MGVWDRDYSKSDYTWTDGGSGWRSRLPSRGPLILIVLHLVGFFVVRAILSGEAGGVPVQFQLSSETLHPAAILLHPFGNRSIWTLIFVVYVVWVLGGRIEARFGIATLLGTYVVGTLIAGVVFLGFAQLSSEHSAYALDIPAGAMAAWVLGAWRRLRDEMVSVFGKLMTTAKLTVIGAAIIAGLTFLRGGPGATGWLIAAAAGSLAWPVVNTLSEIGSPTARLHSSRRGRAAGTAPPQDAAESTDDAELDEILAKISREGLESLSPGERQRLEAARRARQRRSR
jgi:hypothetical protein